MAGRHDYNETGTFPLPLTIDSVVEHMRADALMFMVTRGADDLVGDWLWRLAQRIEDEHTDAWADRAFAPTTPE